MVFLQPPALALTNFISVMCRWMSCDDNNYPSPVSLLPNGFQTSRPGTLREGRTTQGGIEILNRLKLDEMIPPIVETELGVVQGYFMKVVSGRSIYAFEGIPYAQPPVGLNRFRAPQVKSRWSGILSTKNPGPNCIQLEYGRLKGSEDCLRLNVYTPHIQVSSPSLPVLIFIHGGSFLFGSGDSYGPAYLLEEDVILVTINYRLGIMGSMTTGDEVASGNWGLKDQAMAINWVYENIENFGGNKSLISVSGQSAGAVSAHIQLMSPLANDKISSVIFLSGNAYNFWGMNSLEKGVEVSLANARVARCPVFLGSQAVINCMRQVNAELLVANQMLTIPSGFPLPCIEPNVTGAILPASPDEMYAMGKVARVPLITTSVSEEANVFVAEAQARRLLPILKQIYDLDLGLILGFRGKVSPPNELEIVRRIKSFYAQGMIGLTVPRQVFTELGNDRYFITAFHKTIQMHSQIAPTYAGIFSYTSEVGKAAKLGLDPKQYGVAHSEDLIYFLNSTSHTPIARKDYSFAVSKLMVNILTNFAATREPQFTAEDGKMYKFWDKVNNPENIRLLQIDEEVKMISDPFVRSTTFWESLDIPDTTPYFKL